ncbi:MAG TPA: hypothetical protein VLB90_08170 [Pseudomonadales bacterium]|nr:hypothetical protein [Pseudomonadales bacterium]
MSSEDKISALRARCSHDELQRINRLTGLQFETVPESLLKNKQEDWEAFTESLLDVALNTWSQDVRQADG